LNHTLNEIFYSLFSSASTSLFSPSILRSYHHRHVYTCLTILILVILYIIILWRLTTFSTWLLAVTAFSLELIVRLLASLAQYTVYVLDAHNRLSNVDSFDEYIFRIKAVTSCFEFILGVFLLFNGFYILCFESRGALRALMLAIHAYLNIIKNLRRGWQIFRNRKSAWDNVNQLPLATEKQIEEYNDICSICHNTLTFGGTCITPCSHIFHQKCLQKAFYATQNCALCSRPIILEKNQHRE
jgi:E3 ubiquitin-protein ligase RNF139